MKKLIVNTEKEILLSKYILNNFKNLKYNSLQKSIRNKDIKLNGKRINKDICVRQNDILEIYIQDDVLLSIPHKIKYYFNDENIVIAFKWQGIITTSNLDNLVSFEEIVKKDLNLEYLKSCHRLDTNTSGLVILARSEEIFNEIKNAFSLSNIEKHYIAYASGYKFDKTHDILNAYILKDAKTGYSKITQKNVPMSKKITTEYNVLSTNKEMDYAILDITLHTGKTHQIRCHLASIGHALIGDSKYGKNDINRKFNKSKQLLVAYKYKFNFDNKSVLHYLNNKIIKLEKEALNLL